MTVSRVVIGGNTVGIVDVEEVFKEAEASGHKDSELMKDFIMDKVKAKNYIPFQLEPTYREDLFEEFLVFTGESSGRRQTGSVIEIRLYGASCSRCEHLDSMIKHILSRQGLRVDYQYITDTRDISLAGIILTPALVVAGKLVLSGQVPAENHLESMVMKALDPAEGGT